MPKYTRILYWSDEDNCWIVEVPEFPVCRAGGETKLEAMENIEKRIKERELRESIANGDLLWDAIEHVNGVKQNPEAVEKYNHIQRELSELEADRLEEGRKIKQLKENAKKKTV